MRGALHIVKGLTEERVIPLTMGRYEIGRGEDVAIQIDSQRVSRRHAEVVVEGNSVRLLDCGSSNGTLVNGISVATAELHDGDRITIGEAVLEYHRPNHEKKRSLSGPLQEVLGGSPSLSSGKPRSMRKILIGTFALSLASLSLLAGLTFRGLLQDRLASEAMDRASGLVRFLAEKNREDLRLGNELLLDVESVSKEKGVREALIISAKGRILAPISRLNQVAKDPFSGEALNQKSDRKILPSPRLSDGSHIFVHPIRAYNDQLGSYETLGVAKIVFSPDDAVGSLPEANRLIFLLLSASLGLALVLGWAGGQTIIPPLLRLAERIHQQRAGLRTKREGSPFIELTSLYDAVDRAAEEDQK